MDRKMKITLDRLKEIIKEEIAEARLPDTMKAGFGDPQDDEREDAMGPRVPHEFSLTGKWEDDLAMFIRMLKGEQQSLDGHTNKGNKYARLLKPTYHMVISRLKSMQSDLGRDLPVRRHGQGEPIDPTKYVEAPSQMEQDQIVKAVGLIQAAFSTMAQGKPVDHTELEAAVRSAWPYGSRQYWSVKGGKSKTGGGYEYDPEMDTPTYFENLQKIIRDELEKLDEIPTWRKQKYRRDGTPHPGLGPRPHRGRHEGNLTLDDVKELLPHLSSGEQVDVWEKHQHLNNQDELRNALQVREEET
jgi:hypothetical protein